MPKIHRPVLQAVVQALDEVFNAHRPCDKVIEKYLKTKNKWGSRDRRFFAEVVYDIVRNWRGLLLGLNHNWHDEDLTRTWPQTVFEGAFCLWYGSKYQGEPSPLAEWEGLVKSYLTQMGQGGFLRRADRESIPDWMDEVGESNLKLSWDSMLHELNQPAPQFLRANRLKTTRDELKKILEAKGIFTESYEIAADALRLKERTNVFASPAFKQGMFEMQDLHSQMVAPMLEVEPHHRVVDACAGAGGKTLHLAALLKNRGRIIALDVAPSKLAELKRRARRAGAVNIETRWIDSTKVTKRLSQSADRVLLDVPCSGLGVLRRNPDKKWKLMPSELERLVRLQEEILKSYSSFVKPGGKLVYATCSVLPKENDEQIKKFLAFDVAKEWSLEEEKTLVPSSLGGDGFYIARLARRK